jgi:hypothetical protein
LGTKRIGSDSLANYWVSGGFDHPTTASASIGVFADTGGFRRLISGTPYGRIVPWLITGTRPESG